jgi:hypothetical protein
MIAAMGRVLVKTVSPTNVQSLKRDVLLYDEIWFDPATFQTLCSLWEQLYAYIGNQRFRQDRIDPALADLNYLIDKKVLVPHNSFERLDPHAEEADGNVSLKLHFPMDWAMEAYRSDIDRGCDILSPLLAVIKDLMDYAREESEGKLVITAGDGSLERMLKRISDRTKAMFLLCQYDGSSNIYVSDAGEEWNKELGTQFLQEQAICNIILRKLPIPTGNESYERLLDFRSEASVRESRLSLFRWAVTAARTEQNTAHIEEELEHLMIEYERLLKLHELSFTYATAELGIVMPLEVIENAIKLRWGAIAKQLFAVKQKHVDYLVKSASIPGREIRFLCEVARRFGR